MNFWAGMESDRERERARDSLARDTPVPTLPTWVVVRAFLVQGATYYVLVLLGLGGWLWWAGSSGTAEGWGIWAIAVAVASFAVPLVVALGVGERMRGGQPGRLGLVLAWLVTVTCTAAVLVLPTLLVGPRAGIAGQEPFDGEPVRVLFAVLTPLLAGVVVATVPLQTWHLPLWLNGCLSSVVILAGAATMLPLPLLTYGDPAAWVESVAVLGWLVVAPVSILGVALVPCHRVAAVAEYSARTPT